VKAAIRNLRRPRNKIVADRFPGDPGRGYLYVGTTNPPASKGVPLVPFEAEMWPDGLTKQKLVREYGQTLLINSADRSQLTTHSNNGRITLWSNLRHPYSFADIVNGAADADLASNATFFKTLKNPVWFCIAHEPETKTPDPPAGVSPSRSLSTSAERNNFRQAYRYVRNYYKNAGVTNIAYIGSYIVSDTYRQVSFWYEWDPDYMVGDPTYKTGDPKFADIVDCDGWDPYNPRVELANPWVNTPNARTKSWPDLIDEYRSVVQVQFANGKKDKPMVIGELGIYGDDWPPNATVPRQLQQDGMTPEIFYNQMATIGTQTGYLVGVSHWNNAGCAPDDIKDPSGDRRLGWKKMCALPQVKMIEL
jgi:hypothetical protein